MKTNRRMMRRWDRNADMIIEKTLDGNIFITHPQGGMCSTWSLEVEDGTVDLTCFKRSYAMHELAPPLEDAGYEVLLPEPKSERGFWRKLLGL